MTRVHIDLIKCEASGDLDGRTISQVCIYVGDRIINHCRKVLNSEGQRVVGNKWNTLKTHLMEMEKLLSDEEEDTTEFDVSVEEIKISTSPYESDTGSSSDQNDYSFDLTERSLNEIDCDILFELLITFIHFSLKSMRLRMPLMVQILIDIQLYTDKLVGNPKKSCSHLPEIKLPALVQNGRIIAATISAEVADNQIS